MALVNDPVLRKQNIVIDSGNAKNPNKNPIAKHAIGELATELLHLSPTGGPVSPLTLAFGTANLNSRIQRSGLSAREIWTQRDQVSGDQLPLDDPTLILNQHSTRTANHTASAKSKAHGKPYAPTPVINVGALVYLLHDRKKHFTHKKYIVTSVGTCTCEVRKFTIQQFCSRSYEVSVNECYPIQSLAPTRPHNCGIRGLEFSEESDEEPDADHLSEITPSSHDSNTTMSPETNKVNGVNHDTGSRDNSTIDASSRILGDEESFELLWHSVRVKKVPQWQQNKTFF